MRRGGLGRGLSALIPGGEEGGGRVLDLPLEEVEASRTQPRVRFVDEPLAELARSIREVGVLQPVIVRRSGEGYELIAGERRVRAARLAGLATIPALVRDSDDPTSRREALIENIHREDLGPLELAAGFLALQQDLGVTQEALAERLGSSRAHVANTIRLLSLPADVQRLLSEGQLQAGHARALLGLADDEARSALALRIAAEGLSVREVEGLVRTYAGAGRAKERSPRPRDAAMEAVEEALSDALATRVRLTGGGKRGRIVVEFGSREDLDRIVTAIVARGGEESGEGS